MVSRGKHESCALRLLSTFHFCWSYNKTPLYLDALCSQLCRFAVALRFACPVRQQVRPPIGVYAV